jgi:hypothetical protein
LHAGDRLVVYATDPDDGTPIELARHALAPPRDAEGRPEPGQVAWSANGEALFATVSDGVAEVAAFRVLECGRRLEPLYHVAGCPEEGVANRGRALLTANQAFITREEYTPRCPVGDVRRPPIVYLPAARTAR